MPSSSRQVPLAGDRENRKPSSCSKHPPAEAGLAGYWHLLKADLLRALGKAGRSREAARCGGRVHPASARWRSRRGPCSALLDRKKFDEAIASVEASSPRPTGQGALAARSRAGAASRVSPATARAIRSRDRLSSGGSASSGRRVSPESRPALLELAQEPVTPDPNHPPAVWDALAAASGARGRPGNRRRANGEPPPAGRPRSDSQTRRHPTDFVPADFCFRPAS